MFNSAKEFNKKTTARRDIITKRVFNFIYNVVKKNEESIKNKTVSSKKEEKVMIIYKRYIIYQKPMYEKFKVYYIAFL